MKLEGANRLHLALERRYGAGDPFPTYDGRRRGAWRCPACEGRYDHAHVLTVARDVDGDPPECSNGCSEDAIWRALGHDSPSPNRTDHAVRARNRTEHRIPVRNRTALSAVVVERMNTGSTSGRSTGRTSGRRPKDVLPKLDVLPELEAQRDVAALDRMGTQRHAAEAAAEWFGANGVPLGSNFACPIPHHDGEASGCRDARTGVWKLRCWCSGRFFTLAEIRAALAYGGVKGLSDFEAAVWYRRLWAEVGLIAPVAIQLGHVADAPSVVQSVRAGFALLVGLRWLSHPGQPVTFARAFAAVWCDAPMTEGKAYRAIVKLAAANVITGADAATWVRYAPKLWLPGPVDGPTP